MDAAKADVRINWGFLSELTRIEVAIALGAPAIAGL